MVHLNPGSGVKDVSGVYINPGNGVKEVVGIWRNVNGTLYQVYPDYAYDGTRFAGVLKNGVINLPPALQWSAAGNSRQNTSFNNAVVNQAITSGALYVQDFLKYASGDIFTPAICVSADNIPFSKYTAVQITGNWQASGQAQVSPSAAGDNAIIYSPVINLQSITISGTTSSSVTRYASAETEYEALGAWKLKSGSGNSGVRNFDVTIDISGFTRDDTILELLIDSGGFEYYPNRTESACSFNITGIKFIL